MKPRIVAFGLAAALTSTSALAQEAPTRFYGEVGYTELLVAGDRQGVLEDEADTILGAVTGRLGARFGRYFGLEGELSFGVIEDEDSGELVLDDDALPFAVTTRLRHAYAAYGIGSFPVSERFEVFARIGLGHAEVETEVRAPSLELAETVSGDGDFFALGSGGRYMFDDRNGLRVDYTRYELSDDGGRVDAVSIAYVRVF